MIHHLRNFRTICLWVWPATVASVLLCISWGSLVAQETASVPQPGDRDWLLPVPELMADASIPDSKAVLRYGWGDEISSHFQIETFLNRLADAAPDRARLVQYGKSYEGRSLNYLVISSPENLQRLDEIRSDNLRLGDASTPADVVDSMIESSPAIVWLAYAVHGNEISPSDAALVTAYHLLADQRAETRAMLDGLVVIIDPLQNPDGRDRFVNVYRETRGLFQQSHPSANEHTERWPGGRSNHYWFDMNRDWFLHSQQEVRAKVAAYLDWQPQIYVDAHEMGANSSFYFPPPTDPKNPYLMPAQHHWFGQLGKHQAGWFDRYGFGYMTREVFDAFYPGYGSEWPTLQGGLGVLWEQASARGAIVDRNDETQLTYHDGVRHHYVSGLATLEFAHANRKELLSHFRRAKLSAVAEGSEGPVQHYFLQNEHPHRSAELASMLQRNGIVVNELNDAIVCTAVDTRSGEEKEQRLAPGSYHIAVAQPNSRLIRALLERSVKMDEKFLRRQLERNEQRLPDEIYDVTAWSTPLAFDVECLSTRELPTPLPVEVWAGPGLQASLTLPDKAQVAYLIPGSDGAMRMAAALLQQAIRLHVADEPFKLGGRNYARGTLIAKVAENDSSLHADLQSACTEFGVEAVATDTAYVEEGAHMGGPDVQWIKPPKVLMVVDSPTNYSSGHTWYLFDQVLNYPTTRVAGENFAQLDLTKFNTIILPDGRYHEGNGFGPECRDKLESWMQTGGTLITLRGGTAWAASKEIGLLKNAVLKRKVPLVSKSTDASKSDSAKSEEIEEVTPDNVPGAFFRTDVLQKHWVTFHFRPQLDVFYSGRLILAPTQETEGRSLVTFAAKDQLLTSGFCWPESLELLAETPYAVHREIGEGHLIAFADDPNYRAMYPALQRLFINAAMFGASH